MERLAGRSRIEAVARELSEGARHGLDGQAEVVGDVRPLHRQFQVLVVAALTRICAALQPQWGDPLLSVAALAWAGAFLGFAALFAPLLLLPKRRTIHAVR